MNSMPPFALPPPMSNLPPPSRDRIQIAPAPLQRSLPAADNLQRAAYQQTQARRAAAAVRYANAAHAPRADAQPLTLATLVEMPGVQAAQAMRAQRKAIEASAAQWVIQLPREQLGADATLHCLAELSHYVGWMVFAELQTRQKTGPAGADATRWAQFQTAACGRLTGGSNPSALQEAATRLHNHTEQRINFRSWSPVQGLEQRWQEHFGVTAGSAFADQLICKSLRSAVLGSI
jgi:hypothetical protein